MKIPCGSACKGLLSGLLFLLAVIIAPLVSTQTSAAPPALNNHDLGLTPQSPPPATFVGVSCDGQSLTYLIVDTAYQTSKLDRSVSSTGYLASIATRTRRTDVPPITVQPQTPTYLNIAAFQPSDGQALDYQIAADAYRTSEVDKPASDAASFATRMRNLEVPPITVRPRQSLFYCENAALGRYGKSNHAYLSQCTARGQPWRT